jgi:hypothetical protein
LKPFEAAPEIDTSVPKGERCGRFVSSVRPSFDLTEWLAIGSSFVISRAYGARRRKADLRGMQRCVAGNGLPDRGQARPDRLQRSSLKAVS